MAKLKFDGDWKAFLFAHCEKMVAGFIVLITLVLVWNAMGKEGLPVGQQPSDIDNYAKQASSKISKADWELFRKKPESEDLTRGSIMTQIPGPIYDIGHWNKPIIIYKPPRRDPRLYAVEELRAQAGFGTMAFRGAKARATRIREVWAPRTPEGEPEVKRLTLEGVGFSEDDVIRGARWAVVTGVIPTGEQEEEYLRVFRHAKAYDPRSDYPLYYGYYIQRTEVTEDATVNWSPERLISPSVIVTEMKKWSTSALPLVKSTFIHRRLTYPLPPLLIRAWDASVVHPKIPLANSQGGPIEETTPTVDLSEPEERPNTGNLVDNLREGFDEEENSKRRRRLDRNTPDVSNKKEESREISALKMFRFFDFDVEPGKRYRYRVRLMMRDVNYERLFPAEGFEEDGNARVEVRFLDPKVVQRIQKTDSKMLGYISTEWSEPSTVVTILDEERIFAGPVVQPTRPGTDPTATILIKNFDVNTGDDASTTMELSRGSIVNTDSQALVINPKEHTVELREDYSINTEAILVDISGGAPLAGKSEKEMTQPGEVLLMSASGRLMVRSELANLAEMRSYNTLDENRGFKEEPVNNLGGLLGGDGGLIAPAPKPKKR